MKKTSNLKTQSGIDKLNKYLNSDWVYILLLLIFCILIFRELIIGQSWLHDDFPYVYYPGKFLMAVSLANDIFPYWNPFAFSGTPFFADPQIGILYPLNYVMKYFVSNNSLNPLVVQNIIVLHFFLASVFAYLFAKELKLNKLASFVFGMIYTYSAFMIIHMMHMNLLESLIWLPLALFLFLKFINTDKYFYIILTGLTMCLSILGGYPQTFVFNFIFLGLFALYYIYKNYKSKKNSKVIKLLISILVIVIISGGISSFQLFATNEFSENSERQNIGYEFAKQGSVHPLDIFTLFVPKIFGTFNWNEKANELQYWSVSKSGGHQEGSWMFTISTLYISLLALIFIIPAIRYYFNSKEKNFPLLFFGIVGLIALFFSFGGNFFVHKIFFDFIPLFDRFRNPGHITFIFTITFGLIAAYGIDRITEDKKQFSQFLNKKYLIFFSGFVLLFTLAFYTGIFKSLFPLSSNTQINDWIKSQVNIFFLFSALYLLILYFNSNGKLKLNLFYSGIIAILCLELYVFGFNQNNGSSNPNQMYSQDKSVLSKLKPDSPGNQFRVNMREGSNMLFQRQQGLVDEIQLIEGVNVLTLNKKIPPPKSDTDNKQSLDLLNVKYKINVQGKQSGLTENSGFLPRAKIYNEFKVFNTENDLLAYMKSPDFDYYKTIVLEKQPKLSIDISDSNDISNNKVEIKQYEMNRIELESETNKNSILLLSEIYYPAWKAFVNGIETEIIRANYCLRAIELPAGKNKIEFIYKSESTEKGKSISLITLGLTSLLLIGSLIYEFKSRKKL